MNKHVSPWSLIHEEELNLAERELYAFIAAVTELYGQDQVRLSAEDWLDELQLMVSPPRSKVQSCRAVTIAASVRLANRIKVSTNQTDQSQPRVSLKKSS